MIWWFVSPFCMFVGLLLERALTALMPWRQAWKSVVFQAWKRTLSWWNVDLGWQMYCFQVSKSPLNMKWHPSPGCKVKKQADTQLQDRTKAAAITTFAAKQPRGRRILRYCTPTCVLERWKSEFANSKPTKRSTIFPTSFANIFPKSAKSKIPWSFKIHE